VSVSHAISKGSKRRMKNLLDELDDAKKAASKSDKSKSDKEKEKESKKGETKSNVKSKSTALAREGDDLGDIELGVIKGKKNSKFMEAFFKEVEEVQHAITFIKHQTKSVVQLSDKAVKAIGQEAEKKCSDGASNYYQRLQRKMQSHKRNSGEYENGNRKTPRGEKCKAV